MNQKIGPREAALRAIRANQLSPGKVAGCGRLFITDPINPAKVREVAKILPPTSGKKPVKRKVKQRRRR